jgi:hypothetical protein
MSVTILASAAVLLAVCLLVIRVVIHRRPSNDRLLNAGAVSQQWLMAHRAEDR